MEYKFVRHGEFEALDGKNKEERYAALARNGLRILMMGWNWKGLYHLAYLDAFKAAFIERNPDFLRQFRKAFQEGFIYLYEQLKDKPLKDDELEQFQHYLYNCLNLLPYSDLTPYESIKIPQWQDNQWQLIEYAITAIELTEPGRKILDKDRVFAYGLTPLEHPKAPSHLIFMGTTYPAGQGFVTQVTTDLTPLQTVGENLYHTGKDRILQWIDRQNGKVSVSGISLGGSLTLLLAMDQGDKISEARAQNPAGLHKLEDGAYDNWNNFSEKPRVVIQRQADDPVSAFGYWKPDWEIQWVFPPKDKQGPSSFFDHFLNYAGFDGTRFEKSEAEVENQQRQRRNYWLYNHGRTFVYYGFVWPFHKIIRPLWHIVRDYRTPLVLLALSCFAIAAAIIIAVGTLPAVLVASISLTTIAVAGLGYAAFDLASHWLLVKPVEDNQIAQLHNPQLPRNPEMDIYNKNNKMSVEFSYKELLSYYKIKHCLLKETELVPDETATAGDPFKTCKRDLLLKAQKNEHGDETVKLTLTKAKAFFMKSTLNLLTKHGEDSGELKQAVETLHQDYKRGMKH